MIRTLSVAALLASVSLAACGEPARPVSTEPAPVGQTPATGATGPLSAQAIESAVWQASPPAAASETPAAGAAPAAPSMMSTLLFPIILIAIMYFLMIRPQMKRQKEHRAMLDKLSKGDEVITNGGIAGTVAEIGENFITVEIASNVQVRLQKGAIASVLPKGTLKAA